MIINNPIKNISNENLNNEGRNNVSHETIIKHTKKKIGTNLRKLGITIRLNTEFCTIDKIT